MSKSIPSILGSVLVITALTAPADARHRNPVPSRFLGGRVLRLHEGQGATPATAKTHRGPRIRGDSGLIVYDEPDAKGDTLGYGINAKGQAVGEFVGSDGHTHGYLRAPDDTFTEINARNSPSSAFWLNDKGAVIGNYFKDGMQHVFIRTAKGRIVTFDPAGSVGAYGLHINNDGTATGDYVDSSGVWHGFLRARDGTFTAFDEPKAASGADQGTYAGATNVKGDTTGPYVDADYVLHGYVRHENGSYDEFDVPGAVDTIPFVLNVKGWVVGFSDDADGVLHGFIRKPNGKIVTVDAPDAGSGPGQGTVVGDINKDGIATGNYIDASDVSHGFLCTKDGVVIKEFDAPGAGPGGTTPVSINADGEISGFEFDDTGSGHGVIGSP